MKNTIKLKLLFGEIIFAIIAYGAIVAFVPMDLYARILIVILLPIVFSFGIYRGFKRI